MMKKNIFIIGVPRSGKSTLANIVCDRFGVSLVSIDAIVATFYNVFPELGMHAEPEKSEPIVSKFIFEYMRQLSTESPNRKFVIEGCHIQPATVVANTDCEKYDVVCMGYPGLTPEQFFHGLRAAQLIRKRYTVLDLTYELGLLDEILGRIEEKHLFF